jgi:hypothetical protein
MASINWEEVVDAKRLQQTDAISTFTSAELTDVDNKREHYNSITDIDEIAHLAGEIEKGKYSSEDVTKAYILRWVYSLYISHQC